MSAVTEYSSSPALFPPTNWLGQRHRDLPCVFRDTFSSTAYWTTEQESAIRDTFKDWDSDEKHPLLNYRGSILEATTRTHPRVLTPEQQQNHTLAFYVNRLQQRAPNETRGSIISAIDINDYYKARSFKYGPSCLSFYQYDVHYALDPNSTELTIIAGMYNCWTPVHIDSGGDSTWQCLLEGQKMWIFGRPEQTRLMKDHFDRGVTWSKWSLEDKLFMKSNHLFMVIQSPGDIVYVPHGWPHMVKHLTNTIAINSTVLNSWNIAQALDGLDFARNKMTEADRGMYARVVSHVVIAQNAAALELTSNQVREITAVYEKKGIDGSVADAAAEAEEQIASEDPALASVPRQRKKQRK